MNNDFTSLTGSPSHIQVNYHTQGNPHLENYEGATLSVGKLATFDNHGFFPDYAQFDDFSMGGDGSVVIEGKNIEQFINDYNEALPQMV
jgi:hypothetical protein